MVYKFQDKQNAVDFCVKVNKGEGIYPDPKNVTTGYCQPFEYQNEIYVLADSVTAKYIDKVAISLKEDISKKITSALKK